jgi:threonine dehydrogenase-like Zn-dependent dehydrogenase
MHDHVCTRKQGAHVWDVPTSRSDEMRAVAMFPKARELRLIERPYPAPVSGSQVLLKVHEVGICGTDREIVALEHGAPPPGSDFLILGHEALAEVAEVGPDVTLVRKGDLVVPTVRRPCPHKSCRPCRVNRPDFCVTGDYLERGIKGLHGFMQEWLVEDEENLVTVPPKLQEVAVLTEPLTVAAKAAEQAVAIQRRLPWQLPKRKALTLGAGPVGLLGALSMKVSHFDTYVYSLEPATDLRAQIVRDFGATYISGQQVPLGKIKDTFGQFDSVYEAVGVPHVAFGALETLVPNGFLMLTGVPPAGKPGELDQAALMRAIVLKNQLIVGTVNASWADYEIALRELEQGMFLFPNAVRALITSRHTMDEVPKILNTRGGIKQIVQVKR